MQMQAHVPSSSASSNDPLNFGELLFDDSLSDYENLLAEYNAMLAEYGQALAARDKQAVDVLQAKIKYFKKTLRTEYEAMLQYLPYVDIATVTDHHLVTHFQALTFDNNPTGIKFGVKLYAERFKNELWRRITGFLEARGLHVLQSRLNFKDSNSPSLLIDLLFDAENFQHQDGYSLFDEDKMWAPYPDKIAGRIELDDIAKKWLSERISIEQQVQTLAYSIAQQAELALS